MPLHPCFARSPRGRLFRQWATTRLRELLIKGFTLDDERIKAGRTIGHDYFDELLARIRDIRASERLFYQKITDIYTTTPTPRSAKPFSQPCKTNCTGQFTATRLPRSCTPELTPPNRTWGS